MVYEDLLFRFTKMSKETDVKSMQSTGIFTRRTGTV